MVKNTETLSPNDERQRQARIQRYAMQDAARDILPDGSRTRWCLRARAGHSPDVEVWRNQERNATHYRGLMVCSSVWCCPPCAAKITERRRQELQGGLQRFITSGGTALLVTSTVPHGSTDRLDELLKRIARARDLARGGKVAASIRHKTGLVGTVRCMEVTYGTTHGWHPHLHEIWAMTSKINFKELEKRLFEHWHKAALSAGLGEPAEAHGLDVRGGSAAGDYISKWGAIELTKAHSRKGRDNRFTPFDFLRMFADGIDKEHNAELFLEYAEAFAGRRQLVWSKGLKTALGIADKSDHELNNETRELAELLGRISPRDWLLIREVGGARAEVLEIAREGWPPLERFIEGLRQGRKKTD